MSEGTSPGLESGSPIVVDSLGSDDESDTQTIKDSFRDYPELWGRTYHAFKQGSYQYPNDEPERERYDFMHNIFVRIHESRLFFAPVREARKILDIGTGTGIWAIELSDSNQCPHAVRITGVDLSPIQPKEIPDNVRFEMQDISERDWQRPLKSLDYIHVRMMLGSLKDPSAIVNNARRYLKPGTGWLEWHDPLPLVHSDDNSIPEDWAFAEWEEEFNRCSRKLGYPLRVAHKIKRWMEEAGYVDVHEHVNKLPIGRWPRDPELKKIGIMWSTAILEGLPAISQMVFSEALNWNQSVITGYLAHVRKGLAMKGVHAYHKLYVVYGRRPSASEEEEIKRRKAQGASNANGH